MDPLLIFNPRGFEVAQRTRKLKTQVNIAQNLMSLPAKKEFESKPLSLMQEVYMVERARTKDEAFMLRLYDEASQKSDIEDPIDRYYIGQLVGLQQKAVDTICTLLAQANFIKKHGKVEVAITPHGIKLVETLRNP